MIANGFRIRHLSFLGPNRPVATLSFAAGLNVVFGASNTGKSFIVESIDYMLGGRGPLRDIPERVGYDQVLLGIEFEDSISYTLARSPEGGDFRLFEGLHAHNVPASGGVELAEQHSDRTEANLSTFLLDRIGLAKKRVRRNKRNETQSLSFRNLARLAIVNEEEIIQQRSPLSDGNYTADTANTAVFKLLLTGVDDSSLVATGAAGVDEQSREGKIELLDQLIADLRRQVKEHAGTPGELRKQLVRLEGAIAEQRQQLATSEGDYRQLSIKRRELLEKLEEASNRLTEIDNLRSRFTLLDEHYASDVERLKGLEEGGSLLNLFDDVVCPLCGAAPGAHQPETGCDGNTAAVIIAAQAERAKIEHKQTELAETLINLDREAKSFRKRLPNLESAHAQMVQRIETMIAPSLRQLRRSFGELTDKRAEIRGVLSLVQTLEEYERLRERLKSEQDQSSTTSNSTEAELSTSVVEKFAARVLVILREWHFPNIGTVHFDLKIKDLIINGKSRISFGKGLRAITQAAFSIGLLEYCKQQGTEHPAFVVLDSPLLSYKEPEGEFDDLRGTDLNVQFYSYLARLQADRQVIVVENTDPPDSVLRSANIAKFSGREGIGRPGFFPTEGGLDRLGE